MIKILLLIPCYNEEFRLDLVKFTEGRELNLKLGVDLNYLFIDDGSTDKTSEILSGYVKNSSHRTYKVLPNKGKANALYTGYQEMKSKINFSDYNWIGYWDADLATPLTEVAGMIKYAQYFSDTEPHAIWGSRISRLGSDIQRQLHRHYLGSAFVTVVSISLGGIKAYDSQCGAKLFNAKTFEKAFATSFISRWIFDIEILLRLSSEVILEYPLKTWKDIPGSKVKIFKEIFRVLWDLKKIRKHYL